MDTQYNTAASAQISSRDTREMDRIEQAADRLSLVSDRLHGFLARFHGMEVPAAPSGGQVAPVPSGYRGQMDRLYDHLTQVEQQVGELISLG